MILPLIAGLLVLLGTAIGLYLTYDFRRQSKLKQSEIEQLNKEIDRVGKINKELNEGILDLSENLEKISIETKNISEKNNELAEINKELSNKNIALANKTIQLSEGIKNIQTGGDSFCVVEIIRTSREEYAVSVRHIGKYVLRSVNVSIDNITKRSKLMESIPLDGLKDYTLPIQEILEASSERISVGNLKPSTSYSTNRRKINPEQNEIRWDIAIFAENGIYHEKLKYVNIQTETKIAIQLTNSDGKILYESISPEFPKNDDGTINWQ